MSKPLTTPVTPETPEESKHDYFVRVVDRRMQQFLKFAELIGDMAGQPYYEYSEAEAQALLARMDEAVARQRRKFTPEPKPDPRQFSLLDAVKDIQAA
jgi:hypothetical protein